ncbi:MAG TPA: hypothetical protein PLE98_00880 [Candidatus Dojkabacteria bacterium]|nr:hypothetical protein [Candidatus Dojkabacteria bacterium]HOR05862.1 hypothetical protein [Candidatus Dojkabacteria bacterium]HQI92548.1 hypothetical protein [Candidatus Dojkabacteria bacterium]
MEDAMEILNNLSGHSGDTINIGIVSLLKLPLIIVLFGNVLFAVLLLLRVRILSETFETTDNKLIRYIVHIYLFTSVIGSIIALLFLLIG